MDKKLIGLLLLFFLSFGLFTAILIFQKPLSTLARASEELAPSATNSKMIIGCGMPLLEVGKTCPIYVFIRGGGQNPIPLANKEVTLSSDLGTINNPSATTDKQGKASFMVTSNDPGVMTIKAQVKNDNTDVAIVHTITLEYK